MDFLNTADNKFKAAAISLDKHEDKGLGSGLGSGLGQGLGSGIGSGLGPGLGSGLGQGLGPGPGRRQSVGGDVSLVEGLLSGGERRGSAEAFKDTEKKVINQVEWDWTCGSSACLIRLTFL